MTTMLPPEQVKGLKEAYEDLEKLSSNTKGIKYATWLTAGSSLVLAIVGVLALVLPYLK